jgi:hypothetical protein
MINKRMISGSMIKIDSMKVGSSFISCLSGLDTQPYILCC